MDHVSGRVRWTNVVSPTADDLKRLKRAYRLHPVIVDEIREPSARSRVDRYDHYIYFIYHFPIYDQREKVSRRSEVDFIITKKEVITISYETIEPLKELLAALKKGNGERDVLTDTLQATYAIFQELVNFHKRQLRHIQEKVEHIGGELFADNEKHVLTEISYLKRDISEYRIIVRPQELLFKSLEEHGAEFWGAPSRIYLSDLADNYRRVVNQVEDFREAVADFEHTNNQLMNIKTTDVMKKFTTLSFMTFPFVLVAAIFSMRTEYTPLVGQPWAFWVITGGIASGILSLFVYFKAKHWL